MKSKESKIAEQLTNAVEDHFFNPAIFGRYLSDQPYYTVDKVMEMIVQVIHTMSNRYEVDKLDGVSSHGLKLANELQHAIQAIKELEDLSNLRLPKQGGTEKLSKPSITLDPIQIIDQTNQDILYRNVQYVLFVCIHMWANISIYERS